VAFRSASYTVDEFESFAAIEVGLNRTTTQTVTVLYITIDDTASSPDDYSSSGGQLTFPPGVTSQSFNVGIIDDMDIEGPETIQLHLGSPINANLGTSNQASLTIDDDDFPGVQFSSPSYSATEASGSAIITVTLTSTAPFVVTVDYATSDGTAAAGSDYTTAGGTLIFNPNVTVRTFSVPVLKDAIIETNETVNLALNNPVKANPGSPVIATLTIVDSTLRQLTATTGCLSNLAPASNGDGTRLIFRSNCDPLGGNTDGSFEIFLFDITTDMLIQLTTSIGCDNTFATINDNGTLIAFDSTCDPFGTNIDLNPELMLLDTSTSALTQLTDTSDCFNQETSINAAGTRIAFRSNCNPLGSNGDFNDEIFLFDTSTNTLSQLTTTTAGCLNAEPSIRADGTRIAFSSNCDPLASNGDLNFEIFLFDTSANTLSQLTTTLGCQSLAPSISDDGTHVALRTSCDPGSNPDGNFEIGLVDVASVILTQLTITAGCNNFAPASNIDATRVVFYSNCDPLGSNGDNNFELFLSNTGTLSQITQTVLCGNQDPASDNSGTRITYISDCDSLGTNGDGNFEIFQAILN
jgi:Tol biopolymer transport system component